MVNLPQCTWLANSEVHQNRSIRTVVLTVMVTSAPTASSLHEKMESELLHRNMVCKQFFVFKV